MEQEKEEECQVVALGDGRWMGRGRKGERPGLAGLPMKMIQGDGIKDLAIEKVVNPKPNGTLHDLHSKPRVNQG